MSLRRALLISLGAIVFGFLAGYGHGNDGGLRGAFGNLIAPWLLVAALPGWWARSPLHGALIGLSSTVVALLGFYLGLTVEMYGHLGSVHGIWTSFVWVNDANRLWYEAGLVSGPVCGCIAALLRRHMRVEWVWAWTGFAFISEFAITAWIHEIQWTSGSFVLVDGLPHLVELLLAVSLFAVAAVQLRRGHLRCLR